MSKLTIFLILLFPLSGFSFFLTTNKVDPARDRYVTVQEYFNQMACTRKCGDKCYNFSTFKWDELSDDCYDCITNCSKTKRKMAISDVNFQLHNVSVCCPVYDTQFANVSLRFSVRDYDVLREFYAVWEYRMSRGIEDLAPSPWMTVLQTRSQVAIISGLVRTVSYQFRVNLLNGERESERAETEWIEIEDAPEVPNTTVTMKKEIKRKWTTPEEGSGHL